MGFLSLAFNWLRSGSVVPGRHAASGGSGTSSSGQQVDESTALNLSAVFAAVRLVASSISTLPMQGYRLKDGKPREPATNHPLSLLFAGKPNRHQTAVEFWQTVGMQQAMHGNVYLYIDRINNDDVNSRITALLPLMADQMQVELTKKGAVIYTYYDGTNVSVMPDSRILHIKSMGNGIVGLSPLAYARNAIGLGIAADKQAANFARKGFKPTGVLMLDKLLKQDQRDAVRANFIDLAEGDGNPLHVLEAGMTYQQISLSPADAQLLETRRFQLEDIARFFGVPPVLIGDMSASTVWGSGVEQIIDGFYRTQLRQHLELIEAAINHKLLSVADRGRYEFEFNLDALLRMSPTARATRVKEHVQGGIMTPNEGRIEMGYEPDPSPAADQLYMQSQMAPLTSLGKVPTQKMETN